MATLLYRLGRFSFRRRWYVLVAWAALLLVLGAGALTLSGQMTNSVTIPGTESQQAVNHLKDRFPQAGAGEGTARVAIAAPDGEKLTGQANHSAVEQVVGQLKDAPKVGSVADPYAAHTISPDDHIALVQVKYTVAPYDITDADRAALTASADPGLAAGMDVEFGGNAMQAIPSVGATEITGVVIAAVVLVITFGSLLAAGLPLVTALIGVGVGMAGITAVSGFVDLNANTPVLALMIGLAVGIDYALFILSRYRSELDRGREPADAAGHALGTAGSAVTFAGLTVVIALAGLFVVGIPFLTQMGVAAALTVVVAVLIALTLVPAVLGFAGRRVQGRRLPGLRGGRRGDRQGVGARWAGFVRRHRVPVLVTAVLGLLVVAIPATGMRLGLPNDSNAAPSSTKHKAYDLISEGFGEGTNGPLLVVVDSGPAAAPGAAKQVAGKITQLDDVAAVTPPKINPSGDTALLSVTPGSGPSSDATKDLVGAIRGLQEPLQESTGAHLAVTGQTALNIDVSDKLGSALWPYLGLIVGLAFILMMLVFRSVLVPLKATLGFLGSVVATLGAVVAVFQWGWLRDVLGVESIGPIMSMLPILVIGVLFGLAMDYQVFLVTRMREEYVHGAEPQSAVATGFRHGSRVVVAAALIMTSVFAGFVVSSGSLIQSIGFALAFGVAVDAFVVRMTIVPAVMSLLGRHAWWLPRWLSRILPRVDIEGEKLADVEAEGQQSREPQSVG